MNHALQFSPYKPVEMFDAFVPQGLQLSLVEGVVKEYQHAKVWCETEFRLPESYDVLPHFRRACIESMLCEIVKHYPDIRITTRANARRNCSHRLLCCGRVMLTQSLVDRDGALPREAVYREGYARDPQLYLFGEQEAPEEDAPLYGIITHMPLSGKDDGLPGFVDIVFPDEEYRLILGRISLLDRFPGVVDAIAATAQEIIPDNLEAKLRAREQKA